jgi:4-hydroxy-tetrahydrodipicolinate synthase
VLQFGPLNEFGMKPGETSPRFMPNLLWPSTRPRAIASTIMFQGTYTAIVTPFQEDQSVDFDAFETLIEKQINGGVDGIVPVGTTGESPTVDFDEHQEIIRRVVSAAAGRCQVIAGTGANSTEEALMLTRHAKEAGADATLQVTPYYNKPSQEGLYRHFSVIADIGLPVVLYNIPGRTSREIEIDTIVRLSAHPGIVAVKEATGSVDVTSEIVASTDLDVLSGDDSLTLALMAVGARGVISVASNVLPGPITQFTHDVLDGNWDAAREIHLRYFQLFNDLFIETNPIPVKAALAMMGLIKEVYRLPMCEMSQDKKDRLAATLRDVGVIQDG